MGISGAQAVAEPRTFLSESGVLAWLFSLDHKRVATMQLGGVAVAGVAGAALSVLMTAERLTPGAVLGARGFGSAMTLHGLVMVFLVLLPGVSATLGGFLLPLQLGARNVAFPRLHLAALHLWLIAALIMLDAALHGVSASGWTLSPPLATEGEGALTHLAASIALLALGAVLRSVVFMVTLHQQRRRGLRWHRLPPLCLTIYAQSALTLVAAPVVVLTMILLVAERRWSIGLFAPTLGGDPTLYRHFFWFGASALLYSCALPAVGVIAEILKAFSNRPIFAPRTLAASTAGFAALALLGYGSHMLVGHGSATSAALAALPALLLTVPVSMFFLVWLGTLRSGTIRMSASLLAALGAMSAWLVGACSGLVLAVPSLAVHLSGTAFVSGHAHYLVVGGICLPLLGGIYLWWPKIAGRALPESLARASVVLCVVGVHTAFFPQLVLGARGLPRGMVTFPTEFLTLQAVSSAGTSILVLALVAVFTTLITSRRLHHAMSQNPLELDGLEWTTTSPPAPFNFPNEHP